MLKYDKFSLGAINMFLFNYIKINQGVSTYNFIEYRRRGQSLYPIPIGIRARLNADVDVM